MWEKSTTQPVGSPLHYHTSPPSVVRKKELEHKEGQRQQNDCYVVTVVGERHISGRSDEEQ